MHSLIRNGITLLAVPTSRFKSCTSCGMNRPWHLDECPNCRKTDYETELEDGGILVQNAIGDSVDESVLFNDELPIVDFSEDGWLSKLIPERIQARAEEKKISVLNNPIAEYLYPGEQPHFILRTEKEILRKTEGEVSKLSPSSDFGPARIVVTDERTLFLIGQNHADVVKSLDHLEIISIEPTDSLLHTSLSIQTESVSFEIPHCQPMEEVKPVVAYIRAQYDSDRSNWEDNFNYDKGDTRAERIKTMLGEVDISEALEFGTTAAKFGSRAGPKGRAVGFTIGLGFGIWRNVSEHDISSSEVPNPDDIAETVKEWQEAGRKTGDARIEWFSASTGAAIALAAENSDHQSVSALEDIDPESIVMALETGSEIAGVSSELLPADSDIENLPDVSRLRQPVSEFSSITAELFREGLFEEMIATHERLDDAESH